MKSCTIINRIATGSVAGDVVMKHRLATAMIMIILAASPLGCGDKAKRLPESGFQVAFESHNVASEMKSGKTVSADIAVKNISPIIWPSTPDSKDRYAVNLSYHWLNQTGAPVVFDGLRTPLPRDLKPGESVDLKAAIQAPEKPGRYILEVTLVQERSGAWFPDKNGAKLALPVTVSEGSETSGAAQYSEKTTKSETQPAAARTAPLKKNVAIQATGKSNRPASAAGGPWSVQLGAYAEKKVATSFAKKLKDKGYDAYVTAVSVKGKEWHRLRVGHLEQRAEAERLRQTLKTVEKQEQAIVTSR